MLAQLLGLYFIIVGAIVMYRQKAIMPAIGQLAGNRALLVVVALVELMAGLAIILTYPELTPDVDGVIAVIGWMLVVEGVLYLAAPVRSVQRFIRRFNRPQWYQTGGALAIVLGIYLAGNGFGFF